MLPVGNNLEGVGLVERPGLADDFWDDFEAGAVERNRPRLDITDPACTVETGDGVVKVLKRIGFLLHRSVLDTPASFLVSLEHSIKIIQTKRTHVKRHVNFAL